MEALAASETLPMDAEELRFEAHQADQEQARFSAERRQRYVEIASSMDRRRHRQPLDLAGYRATKTTLLDAAIPIRENASEDGCSTSICSFTLEFQGRADTLTEKLQATVPAMDTQRKNWALLRVSDDELRLFTFSSDTTLDC